MKKITAVEQRPAPIVDELKSLICNNYSNIQKAKAELKTAKEMMQSAYENNQDYRTTKEKEGEMRKKRNAIQETIKNDNPTVAEKLSGLSTDIKEANSALSDYCLEYKSLTGQTEIEMLDGTKLEIKTKATIQQLKLL